MFVVILACLVDIGLIAGLVTAAPFVRRADSTAALQPRDERPRDPLTTGEIVGICIGGVAGTFLIVGLLNALMAAKMLLN